MSSLASKLLRFSSPHFPLFSSSHLCSSFAPPSTSLPFQRQHCRLPLVRSQEADAGGSSPPDGNSRKSRRGILLEYVRNVQPEFMKLFMERAPKQVVDAMLQTVANIIGTLPPQFFQVTVTTVAENLAQLMCSVMMTGYMFRNAQYRLELQQSPEQVASLEKKDNMEFSDGTEKKVTGEVIKWNKVTGPEKVHAVQYIEFLEAEVEDLRGQLTRRSANGHNELLEYLKSLEPQNLQELTNTCWGRCNFCYECLHKTFACSFRSCTNEDSSDTNYYSRTCQCPVLVVFAILKFALTWKEYLIVRFIKAA